jgi:hypothetical protein
MKTDPLQESVAAVPLHALEEQGDFCIFLNLSSMHSIPGYGKRDSSQWKKRVFHLR